MDMVGTGAPSLMALEELCNTIHCNSVRPRPGRPTGPLALEFNATEWHAQPTLIQQTITEE